METYDLLYIESDDYTLYIKGVPYDKKYNSLTQYRTRATLEKETMVIRVEGKNLQISEVLNIETGELAKVQSNTFAPIFFENGVYQLVITSKGNKEITFYHEHPGIRKAVSQFGRSNNILMGNLQFINEVGYTSFSLLSGNEKLLDVTLEIFPSKLSYKEDYRRLLEEVNDEVYNLAFHFIKKTFLGATSILSENPSQAEFFRLLVHFFTEFKKSIHRIEEQPHHQLVTEYQMVRGDRLKHVDRKGIQYLRSHMYLFEDTPKGISIDGNTFMPKKGLNAKKLLSFDTLENRFVKWMMERLVHKLTDLLKRIVRQKSGTFQVEVDEVLVKRIITMKNLLVQTLKKPFWSQISPLDRTINNLVMQMKMGYREAYKIYLIVSRGLTLQGEMFKMSVKDVATLYEYWTYLKLGQILRKNYLLENQNVVRTRQGALFLDLDESANARQVYRHPQTGEKIILSFQKRAGKLPTVPQKPDMMLEVQKKGIDYTYNYIFDAKYRIDFAGENTYYESAYQSPGPLEDDINTMHRYRDAHVVRKQQGPYERHAFGAYVLFPWYDEDNYESHRFYKSIDEVNIGGFPFLPNATRLVEQFIERLVESNPEDLQNDGILPKGSASFWESNLNESVLVGTVNSKNQYVDFKRKGQFIIKSNLLKSGWQKSKYIALYVTQEITNQSGAENGIRFYGEIKDVKVIEKNNELHTQFEITHWQSLPQVISPVGYGIQNYLETNINMLKEAKDLPELYMKSGEEIKLWRMLKRLTSNVKTKLDQKYLDNARKIQAYQIGYFSVNIDFDKNDIHIYHHDELLHRIPLETLYKHPAHVFKIIKDTVFV
ncbi:DUF2357 domain-containing protein [Heyndrickxia oleronia]|uniref:DUF2357 domain-containing protein n=1 Tax=Heyndrickxia oleronia TaxID=38875 RepID=UPI0037535774